MTNLIERIVDAIIRQEGEPADALNPGNLRGAPWLTNPVIDNDGFWVPVSRAQGVAGMAHVVCLHIAEGNSIAQLIEDWAPGSDGNNTAQYIANVVSWAAIPNANSPLLDFIL